MDSLFFEAVHPYGATTISRFAYTARKSGYDGIVLRDDPHRPETASFETVARRFSVTVHRGATVHAHDRGEAGSEIAKRRSKVSVLFGSADTPELRRFLADQDRLDVLSISGIQAQDVVHTTVSRSRDHGVAIEINLGDVLQCTGTRRMRAINGLVSLYRLVDHYECPYVVTGSPESHLEIRSPRELKAVADVVGIPGDAVDSGLRRWGAILDRSKRIQDDTFIEPGVEVLEDETDAR